MFDMTSVKEINKSGVEVENTLKNSADDGYVTSMFTLANLYSQTGNNDLAEKYYMMAIDNGDLSSIYSLTYHYYKNGEFEKIEKYHKDGIKYSDPELRNRLEKNFEKIEYNYKKLIEDNIDNAITNLAICYSRLGNLEISNKYHEIAAEKGNSISILLLSMYYCYNRDIRATKYYKMGVDNGCILSMCFMGSYYATYVGDEHMSNKYYEMAANKGDREAMLYVGEYYDEIGQFNLAEKYYKMAIENGCIRSILNLAIYYDKTGKYNLAEKYYKMGVDKGCINSILNLAIFCEENEKYDLAEKYYKMGVEKGCKNCMCYLGLYYFERKEHLLTEKYYLMSITNGSTKGLYFLAIYYESIGEDIKYSIYIDMAIEKEYIPAINHIYYKSSEKIKEYGQYSELFLKLEKYLLKAVEKKNTDAMYNIGELYESIENYKKMIKYMKMGADGGNLNSIIRMVIHYKTKNMEKYVKYIKKLIDKDNHTFTLDLCLYYYETNNINDLAMLLDIVYRNRLISMNYQIKILNTCLNKITDIKYYSLFEDYLDDDNRQKLENFLLDSAN